MLLISAPNVRLTRKTSLEVELAILATLSADRRFLLDVAYFQFLPRDAMLARYMLSSCVRSSACLSICLSQAGTVPKGLSTGSRKQRHTTTQALYTATVP